MQDIFGEELKKILQNSKIQVPKAYDKRIEETLSNISVKEKKPYLHFFYSKTAAMITICITVFASSLGAGAAINLYHEKMQSITQEDKKNYNETVQNSEKAGDSYSRSLTKQEEERMQSLRIAYEKRGKFPENKIREVSKKKDIRENELAFCTENSTFYLPQETLTEEQILEIVDYMEKRDYSVREQNKVVEETPQPDEKISKKEAMQLACKSIETMYEVSTDKADVTCEFNATRTAKGKRLASYQIALKKQTWLFDALVEVDSKEGEIQQIAIEHKKQEEYASGIKVDKKEFIQNAAMVRKMQETLYPADKIQNMSMQYVYEKDNTLKWGTVKYIIRTDSGQAVVYLYSMKTKSVYQMYRLKDASYLDKEKTQDELVCEVEIDG